MKTKLILLTLLLMLAMTTWAQNATPRLVVWQKSGEKVYYELADLPETTFEEGQLIIKTLHATVPYLLENIVRYTYEGVANSIDLMPNEHAVSISREGDGVTFRGLKEGTKAYIYASNGVLLQTYNAVDGQSLTISIGHRPAGVYIVKCGTETIKLTRP